MVNIPGPGRFGEPISWRNVRSIIRIANGTNWRNVTSTRGGKSGEVRIAGPRKRKPQAFFCTKTLEKTGRRTAYLFYCEFDHTGRVIVPARGLSASFSRHDSVLKRLREWFAQTPEEQPQVGTLFQFQMLVESYSPLNSSEFEQAQQRFFTAYKEMHKKLFPSGS